MAIINGKLWKDRIEEALLWGKFTLEDGTLAGSCRTCVWGELVGVQDMIVGGDYLSPSVLGGKACDDVFHFALIDPSEPKPLTPRKALDLYNQIHIAYGEMLVKEWGAMSYPDLEERIGDIERFGLTDNEYLDAIKEIAALREYVEMNQGCVPVEWGFDFPHARELRAKINLKENGEWGHD